MVKDIIQFIKTNQFIVFSIVLALVMIANIVLGAVKSKLASLFDKNKLKDGIVKSVAVWGSMVLLYIAGTIKPDMAAITINDQTLTIHSAIIIIFTGAIAKYGTDSIIKLLDLFKISISKK